MVHQLDWGHRVQSKVLIRLNELMDRICKITTINCLLFYFLISPKGEHAIFNRLQLKTFNFSILSHAPADPSSGLEIHSLWLQQKEERHFL